MMLLGHSIVQRTTSRRIFFFSEERETKQHGPSSIHIKNRHESNPVCVCMRVCVCPLQEVGLA